MIIIWIIVSIILFSVIVLVHEWGHFKSARIFWVRVEEFWLWIPPRAKKLFTDKSGTLFSLNWLPIWWFVKLTWEVPNSFLIYDKNKKLYNNENLEKTLKTEKDVFDKTWEKLTILEKQEILKQIEENKASYNLLNKPAWQQSIIMLAWIFMNFVLAFFIFFILFLIWVKPIWINDKIDTSLDLKLIPTLEQAFKEWILKKDLWIIISPVSWSIAEKNWFKTWDVVLKINNTQIKSLENFMKNVKNNIWKEIILAWYRPNPDYEIWSQCIEKEFFEKKLIVPSNWKIWVYIWKNISLNKNFQYKYGFLEAGKYAFLETKNQIIFTFQWLWYISKKIFFPETKKERSEAISQISWPIWIFAFISNSISAWIIFLLIISALISISLWVFNLLPIPALDWWRFLFILINSLVWKLFSKKIISNNFEAVVHFLFFIILIALSIFIWYNDIIKLIDK